MFQTAVAALETPSLMLLGQTCHNNKFWSLGSTLCIGWPTD